MTRRGAASTSWDVIDPSGLSVSTQAQLRRLLEANRLAVEHLDLPLTLRQIIEAAVELVGAKYAAIGVLGTNGRLDEFIHIGMDAETVARIGHVPEGKGLLGALIQNPQPVRLPIMSDDVRSVGTPPGHPPMNSFLGVPLEVRDEIFGHLYLADPRIDAFSAEDQVLVEALATTAGVAIAHARLFEESQRREQWTAATTEITHELLTNDEVDAVQLIAQRVLVLAGADLVAVVLTHGVLEPYAGLVVDRAAGEAAGRVVGVALPPGEGLVRRCLETHRPQLVAALEDGPYTHLLRQGERGPAMAVPLPADHGVRGSLFVLRRQGAPQFTEFDLDVAASLAGHVALALDRADARVALARVRTLEDRDRIARDLHDHVVQRLFAAGLNIQSVCGVLGAGPSADRLGAQVDEIDATIRQIRTTIFGLHTAHAGGGLRAEVLAAVSAATVVLSEPPEVTFRGPLDVLVPESMYADAVAVVREALTNVGRHAHARHVRVVVSADLSRLCVEVVDNGRGVAADVVLSGLDNLRVRAEDLGGSFELSGRDGPGTRLRWSVPLDTAGGRSD
ncbi:MAG: GAF domain-containing protein [Nocardioides sp.]|nr:GAF domain-containing protein [Nocardioides sp.]